MNDQRLIDLEVKISHHEVAIESLQQVTYEQHKKIELLETKIERLAIRLKLAMDGPPDLGPANEKPPHY